MDAWLSCRSRLADFLGSGEADVLMDHMRVFEMDAGAVLLREGEPNDTLYLLCDGEMVLSHAASASPVTLGVVEPGTWLGEIGFIDAGATTATVVASEDCVVAGLTHEQLLELMTADPVLAGVVLGHVNRELAARLRRSSALIVEHITELGGLRRRSPLWISHALGRLMGGRRDP